MKTTNNKLKDEATEQQSVINETSLATISEHADIKIELKSLGYELKVINRYKYAYRETRGKNLKLPK